MFPKHCIGSVVGIGGIGGLITKLGGWLFDYYRARGRIETGYMVMFTICALAWTPTGATGSARTMRDVCCGSRRRASSIG